MDVGGKLAFAALVLCAGLPAARAFCCSIAWDPICAGKSATFGPCKCLPPANAP